MYFICNFVHIARNLKEASTGFRGLQNRTCDSVYIFENVPAILLEICNTIKACKAAAIL